MSDHGYLPLLVFLSVVIGACLGWLARELGVPWELRRAYAAGWDEGRKESEQGADSAVLPLCERYGFPAVMQAVADLWLQRDPREALKVRDRPTQERIEPRVVRQAQDVVRARWQR